MLHTDCMEYMASLPNGAFDLAIVDPPYGIMSLAQTGGGLEDKPNNRKKPNKRGVKGKPNAVNEMRNWDQEPSIEYFQELKRVSKHQIIWGANFMINFKEKSRGWICWDKKVPDSFKISQFETAYSSFNKISRVFRYPWSNEVGFAPALQSKNGINIHPCQKPIALYKWLLTNYAQPGWKILDTHGGSGSICLACHDLGFDLTWMEVNKNYYEAALKRYECHAAQLQIFQP